MLGNPKGKLETVVTKLLVERRYEKALLEASQTYQIKQYKVTDLIPSKILEIYYKITTKFYFNHHHGYYQPWHENQLRVFIWLLVGYAMLRKFFVEILQGEKDWEFFSDIFNNRNPIIFEFQSKTVLKTAEKVKRWDKEEEKILDSLMQTKNIKNKWNQIAKELFVISNKKYFRTAKQCREHWMNYLNPKTVRDSWSSREDLKIMLYIRENGKKWSKISKILGGKRTQHMVKNRFKSLLLSESKKYDFDPKEKEVQEELIKIMIERLESNLEENEKLSDEENDQKHKQNFVNINFEEEVEKSQIHGKGFQWSDLCQQEQNLEDKHQDYFSQVFDHSQQQQQQS